MIEVAQLRKTYADGTEALRGVTLSFGEGMAGLLGPNGSGKTTLLEILVLGLEPSSGRLSYGGLDPARPRDRAEIRRRIGYVPQEFHPIGCLTGIEYLLHCARLRGVRESGRALRRRAEGLLAEVGLREAARRRSGEYSRGMGRRLAIAQALLHAPALLVVDEPTAGLDPEERIHFRNLVAEVADTTAVLLSTHIVEDVEATCPRLVVIGRGAILFDGPPTDLLRAAEGKLFLLPAGSPLPPGATAVSRRMGAAGGLQTVVHSERPVAGAQLREPVLEDAYAAFLALRGIAAHEEGAA